MPPRQSEVIQNQLAGIDMALAVDPSGGDVNPQNLTRAVYIGGAGNLAVVFAGDADASPVTLQNLAVGMWHEMQIRTVKQTNTTATGIILGF